MAKSWDGGPNFVFAPQWSSGKSNSGQSKNPAITKRGRFNPNPTSCSHVSCMIAAQSKRDKAANEAKRK